MPTIDRLLQEPLPDLAAWTAHFRDFDIPVLAETAAALEALRAKEDEVDANGIGEMISSDPLMTLKVLAHCSTNRARSVITDSETVTAALMLMGISPFFRSFDPQPVVEERLAGYPEALDGLRAVMSRAHRAANFALGFAVHRMDPDAAVIHAGTLLHEFGDLLLWCEAPALALQILESQRRDPSLRSKDAQRAFLNIELADLQRALMKAWRLPELLRRIGDERETQHAGVRSVRLAARLARHSAHGWHNPAIPDDIDEIAALLNLSTLATLQFVRQI
jgi:HD-like signal output (HDOD) protein